MLRKRHKFSKVLKLLINSMASDPFSPGVLDKSAQGFLGMGRQAVGAAAPFLALGALGLLSVIQSNPSQAAVQVLQYSVTDTLTNFPAASATPADYYSPSPQFTVQPFSAALGSRASTTIDWLFTASFTGAVGGTGSGSANYNVSGNFYVDGISYSGGGTGGGAGVGPGSTFSTAPFPLSNTQQFLASGPGNPSLLAVFLRGTAYPIAFAATGNPGNSPYKFTYTNIDSGALSFTTTATVTYTYVPVVAPGPLPLLGAGAAWGWSRRLRRRCILGQG